MDNVDLMAIRSDHHATHTPELGSSSPSNRSNDLSVVKEGDGGDERHQSVALLPEAAVRNRSGTGTTGATTTGGSAMHHPPDDRGGATQRNTIPLRSSTASRRLSSSFLHSPATATFAVGITPTAAGLASHSAGHHSHGGVAAAAGATHGMGVSSSTGYPPSNTAFIYARSPLNLFLLLVLLPSWSSSGGCDRSRPSQSRSYLVADDENADISRDGSVIRADPERGQKLL